MQRLDPVLYEKDGGIAWITLNRPNVLNALNLEMRDALWSLFQAVRDDPDVRVLVMKGAGDRAFSSGADVSEFGTASQVEARRGRRERDLWQLMLDLDKPLIAAVHGYALGAGCEMSMCCDIRVAAEDARFGLPETTLGYIPSAGGTQMLPRTIPLGVAMSLILSGDEIDASEALRLGLVHRVVPKARLYAEAEAWASRFVAMSPTALRYAREAVTRGMELPLVDGLALERRLSTLLLAAPDAAAALRLYRARQAVAFN